MTVKLFALIILLSVESFAIDFTTIGQKEIIDYIKNRADIFYGTKLSERNLQDLLSDAVFTGLEEEAATFAFGKSVSSDPIDVGVDSKNLLVGLASLVSDSETDSVPLKIFLTSDSQGSTHIQMGDLTTTKSSSSKQSVGDFVVTSVQSENNDVTNLDGSITINLGGSTDSHNLTLMKTVYISAEIKVTSLGSEWDKNLLKNDLKLVSLMPSTAGSLYQIKYQSLIRETITSDDGDVIAGVKTSGNVLAHKNADGVLSLAGRLIYGKIEPTLADQVDELVDQFLSLDGSKSRKFFIKDDQIVAANLITKPLLTKANVVTLSKPNAICGGGKSICGGSALLRFLKDLIYPKKPRGEDRRSQPDYYDWNRDSRRWPERSRDGPYSQHKWQYKYDYQYEWGWRRYERNHPDKPVTRTPISSTSPEPEPEIVTSPSPSPSVTTRQPEKVTSPAEPETIATTENAVKHEEATTKPPFPKWTEPELPPLPKGTIVSIWSSTIIN